MFKNSIKVYNSILKIIICNISTYKLIYKRVIFIFTKSWTLFILKKMNAQKQMITNKY